MKKFAAVILCLVLLLSLCSCRKNADDSSSSDVSSPAVSQTENSEEANSSEEQTADESSAPTTSSEQNQSGEKPKNPPKNNTPQNSTPTNNSNQQQGGGSQNIDSTTQEKIEETLPNVVGGTQEEESDPVLGVDYGAYIYEGTFVNAVSNQNIAYFIFEDPNRIVAYDTERLETVFACPLPGRPAEIQVEGNNLNISFPDLKSIKTYQKKTFALVKSISLPNVVSSFCLDGNLVYYSEDDQHCKVFCTNLATNETRTLLNESNFAKTFYYPKLLLNKEKGLLYIGESKSTGSCLYYYNTADFSMHSVYRKDNYGVTNNRRTMFLVNDSVFWGGFRFGTDSAQNIMGQYGNANAWCAMWYAEPEVVITPHGIYDTNTYEYYGGVDNAHYMFVTQDHNVVTVFSHYPGNIIVVVPYTE